MRGDVFKHRCRATAFLLQGLSCATWRSLTISTAWSPLTGTAIHFGGVEGLAKRVRIDHFWDHGLPSDEVPSLEFPSAPKPEDPLAAAYLKAGEGKR